MPTKLEAGQILDNGALAAWFGVKKNTLTQRRRAYLQELEHYADFTAERGKVTINRVYIDTRVKKENKEYQLCEKWFENLWPPQRFSTAWDVALGMYELLYGNEAEPHKQIYTIYKYILYIKNERYGKPGLRGGKRGFCIRRVCKKIEGEWIPLEWETLNLLPQNARFFAKLKRIERIIKAPVRLAVQLIDA